MSDAISCVKCGASFESTAARSRKRGRVCRRCHAEWAKAYRLRRRAEGRPVRRTFNPEYDRAYAIRRREKTAQENRERRKNPEEMKKIKAQKLLQHAVAKGHIRRGVCEMCGDENVHGHHDDYTLPYSVRWLCPKHHRFVHRDADLQADDIRSALKPGGQ